MATINRSAIDLKIIKGNTAQRTTAAADIAKEEAIFFDVETHGIYVGDGNQQLIQFGSKVSDVSVDATGKLTITYLDGSTKQEIDLAIDGALDDLKTTILNQVVTYDDIRNAFSATDTPAKKRKTVPSMELTETIQGTAFNAALSAADKVASVTGNLVVNTDSKNPQVNFFADYNSKDQKIYFYKGTSALETNRICDIDASAFVKDGMLENVEIVDLEVETSDGNTTTITAIEFTWNVIDETTEQKKKSHLNVQSLVDIYTGGDGIDVNGYTISLKIGDGLKINNGAVAIDEDWLETSVSKFGVSSILNQKGKIAFSRLLSEGDPYYYGSSTIKSEIVLPYYSMVMEGMEKSAGDASNVGGYITATANPANIMSNLLYLIANYPDDVANIIFNGMSISYNNDEGVGTIDATPKWYTIS